MGSYQLLLAFFAGVLFSTGAYHLLRFLVVPKLPRYQLYFAVTALCAAGFVFCQLLLSFPADEATVLLRHRLKILAVIAGCAAWTCCVCDLYLPRSRAARAFALGSLVFAAALPLEAFLTGPVRHLAVDWGGLRFDYRFGQPHALYLAYAAFLVAAFAAAGAMIVTRREYSLRSRAVGLAALVPAFIGGLDFTIVLGWTSGLMLAEYAVFIFIVAVFLHFFRAEQRANRRLSNIGEELERRIRERTVALEERNRRLVRTSTTDTLTGFVNRRALRTVLQMEAQRARRFSTPGALVFTACFLDLDNFKHYNDAFGHHAGDLILVEFSALVRGECRSIDIAARYGGDEFVLLLPSTDRHGAELLGTRVLAALVRRQRFEPEIAALLGAPVAVPAGKELSCSIGIAEYRNVPGADPEAALLRADEALLRAKAEGKNRVVVCEG